MVNSFMAALQSGGGRTAHRKYGPSCAYDPHRNDDFQADRRRCRTQVALHHAHRTMAAEGQTAHLVKAPFAGAGSRGQPPATNGTFTSPFEATSCRGTGRPNTQCFTRYRSE